MNYQHSTQKIQISLFVDEGVGKGKEISHSERKIFSKVLCLSYLLLDIHTGRHFMSFQRKKVCINQLTSQPKLSSLSSKGHFISYIPFHSAHTIQKYELIWYRVVFTLQKIYYVTKGRTRTAETSD